MESRPIALDTRMGGMAEATAAFLIRGAQNTLIDTGPAASVQSTLDALSATGVESLDLIVLTHVHLDHAGAAGHLMERFPSARLAAPERVCHHVVEPSALLEGTRAVWGDRADSLLGIPLPVPEERVLPLEAGRRVDLGTTELLPIATPGHTRNHLSLLDSSSGAMVCGDALGIRLPGSPLSRPATPPADFRLDDALESIELIRSFGPVDLLLAHFGSALEHGGAATVDAACDVAAESLCRWSDAIETELASESDDAATRVAALMRPDPSSPNGEAWDRLEAINPTWLNVAGVRLELERGARSTS